ncbi:hypothetical protein GCM10009821_05920 [Aeromicrobium halocynthiae]|uniref:HTH tetR-type domain-containing protein n=1 Tax=Aeromicrobium halocynthiae TaxID=560557 RepID=A0ABN2VT27_9ACTN
MTVRAEAEGCAQAVRDRRTGGDHPGGGVVTIRDSTLARLLDATDELVFSGGIANSPVDAILARAGVSPATMYRAFDSKEALVAAALRRRHERWLAVWDEEVERASDDVDRLLSIFSALERFHAQRTAARWCAFLGTSAEYPEPPEPLAAALLEETQAMRRRLHDLAVPVVGAGAAAELADRLVLVASGGLAMRLRPHAEAGTDVARSLVAQARTA